MSNKMLTLCWPLQMSPAQKVVFISLADQANDDGVCWPSVGSIARNTCLSERAIRNAIHWLEENGALKINDRTGRSNWYTLTPARYAPLHEVHPTPAPGAPPPLHEVHPTPAPGAPITIKEPSIEPSVNQNTARKRAYVDLTALGVSEQAASDWLAVRKAKRAGPITQTVLDAMQREATAAGITLDAAIKMCAERGWQGFKAAWMTKEAVTTDRFRTSYDRTEDKRMMDSQPLMQRAKQMLAEDPDMINLF